MAQPRPADPSPTVELPERDRGPLRKIAWRVLLALTLMAFVTLVAYIGRDGYTDAEDDEVSLLDAFYYATVSITTTGYGDVRPASDGARLATALLVTPARVLFLILLVGTTLEILAEHTRRAVRRSRWRAKLKDHIVICGFGTKGKHAAQALVAKGVDPSEVVVIDERDDARRRATVAGYAAVPGDATRTEVLYEAGVANARAVIVAPDRDDAAVLMTLTTRELNPDAMIVSAVREEENVHLLRQSGANSVITSSSAAGRLLGLATETPRAVEVLEDLMSIGEGLDIAERSLGDDEVGPLADVRPNGPVVAVIRDGDLLRFDDDRAATVQRGDRIVYLCSTEND